jgi:hypothetical protein
LKNRSLLAFSQTCQEHDLAVWKFQRIVMSGDLFFIDLPKDRRFCALTLLRQLSRPIDWHATSRAKDNSVPGRTQTATLVSSDAANPRVPVPKSRVVSLSPTFAGRDLTL